MARNFIERITDAVTELREPYPTKVFGGLEVKSAERPDYGRPYSESFFNPNWAWESWNRNRTIDYSRETGRLDNSSLVMAVVNDTGTALAEAVPSLRIPNKTGKYDVDQNHEAAQVIQRPNPFNTWAGYCGALSLSWWIDGNFYLQKVRNDFTGQLLELWYLPHYLVIPRYPNDGKSPSVPNDSENEILSHYQYNVPGKPPVLIPAKDVIHVKRFVDPDNPRKGIGAFNSVINEIYGDGKAALFTATILKNLGIVVPLLSPKEKDVTFSETEALAFKEKFQNLTTGDSAGQLMVSTIAADLTKFAWSPQELDLKELRKVPESRIAAVTRYPASYLQFLVGMEHGTSYASYKQAREQAYEQVVIPIQSTIAEQFTWQLLPEFKVPQGSKFYFDTSEVRVLQEDRDALYKRESEALRAGGVTLNEFLTSLGKESLPEPMGSIRFVPSTSTPMTPETLVAKADGSMAPEPVDPALAAAGKMADIDRAIAYLNEQSERFMNGPDAR